MNTQSPPTTLSEERLLPCPFCGKQPTSEFCSVGVPGMEDCGYWGIDCTCGMSQVHADDEEFAIEKWNNRHAAEQMAKVQDENDRLKFSLKAADREYELLEEKVDRFEIALTEIASYDKEKRHGDGICPYGCDTPHIAQAALLPPAPEKGGAA